MQAVLAAARGVDRQEAARLAGRGQRESGRLTRGGVLREARRIDGDDRVVAVVAALHEDADERLVVCRAGVGEGAHEREVLHAGGEQARAERGAAGVPEEVSASLRHCVYL